MRNITYSLIIGIFIMCSSALGQNPAGDIDQCANGTATSPTVCTGAAWQNGNLNSNQAHYREGQFVPYRIKLSNLMVGAGHVLTIEYDTTQSGKHALDYIGNFDFTETTADPCSGVSGCDGSFTDFPLPIDSNVANGFDGISGTTDDITQIPGNFRLYGGTITSVSSFTLTGSYAGNSATKITLTFTADVSNPVLAWGGHISTRVDWGFSHSAIAISGSPYHSRLLDLDGSGGNQDRALTAAAVVFPAKLTIIKDSQPNTVIAFPFSTTNLTPSSFTLDDDGGIDNTYSNTIIYDNLFLFGAANSMTVTESNPTPLVHLASITCLESSGGGDSIHNSTGDVPTRTATIIAEEGEQISCTFVNQLITAASVSINGRVTSATGYGLSSAMVTLMDAESGASSTVITNPFGYYKFAGVEVNKFYVITTVRKGYTFEPLSFVLNDTLTGFNIIANKPNAFVKLGNPSETNTKLRSW